MATPAATSPDVEPQQALDAAWETGQQITLQRMGTVDRITMAGTVLGIASPPALAVTLVMIARDVHVLVLCASTILGGAFILLANAAFGHYMQARLETSTFAGERRILARGLKHRGGIQNMPVAAASSSRRWHKPYGSGGPEAALRDLADGWLTRQRLTPAQREVADQLAAEQFTGSYADLVAVARDLG